MSYKSMQEARKEPLCLGVRLSWSPFFRSAGETLALLNRTARDSYTHAPEPECRSVRHAHENRGGQERRAHSARYAGCANLMLLGLGHLRPRTAFVLFELVGLLMRSTIPAAAAPFAYIPNADSNTVSVIDTATNTVTATIPVGESPNGVAVHPAGTFVYVTHHGSPIISIINTATNTVAAIVSVGSYPNGVAVHPAGSFVYVANFYSDTVSVIDTATNTVITTVPVGDAPFGVAVHSMGTYVYVTNTHSTVIFGKTTLRVRFPSSTLPPRLSL